MAIVNERWLEGARVVVRRPGVAESAAALDGDSIALGGVVIRCDAPADGWTWSVHNPGSEPVELDAVAVDIELGRAGEDVSVFCHGYQSWLPSRGQRLGVDCDDTNDSIHPGAPDVPLVGGDDDCDGLL